MCNSLTRDRGGPLTFKARENFAEGNRLNFLIPGISLNASELSAYVNFLRICFFFFFYEIRAREN